MSRVGENIKKVREASGLSAKALAKKVGVSESFLIDLEMGRRVINEAMLQRFSKILGKNVSDLGLDSFESAVFKEEKEVQRQVRVQQAQPVRPPAKPAERSELWDQAFGSNLKNVPVYGAEFSQPKSQKLYPVENGKVGTVPSDKAVLIRQEAKDLSGYGIFPGSLLLGAPVKELHQNGFYLLDVQGKKVIRKVRILGNANVMLLQNQDREISVTVAVKDVKALVHLVQAETDLTAGS